MTDSPFLLSPLIATYDDFLGLYANANPERVVSFRLSARKGDLRLFQPEIHLTLWGQDYNLPALRPLQLRQLAFSMFETLPYRLDRTSPYGRAMMENREVFVLHAPGQLRFRLPAGEHTVTGLYGMVPGPRAYRQASPTRFLVSAVGEVGKEVLLFDRTLDARKVPSDRGFQRLSRSFRTTARMDLILRTRRGPGRVAPETWPFWTGVKIATTQEAPPP